MACFSDDGLRDRDSWCGKAYEYNTVSYRQLNWLHFKMTYHASQSTFCALNESYRQQAAVDTRNTATHA